MEEKCQLLDIYTYFLKDCLKQLHKKKNIKLEYNCRLAKATRENLLNGIFNSFEEAISSAPSTKEYGYNHEKPAAMY